MKIKIVNQSRFALPEYQTPLSAGLDIRANIEESITLAPLERTLVPTGLYVELPEGYEMQIRLFGGRSEYLFGGTSNARSRSIRL